MDNALRFWLSIAAVLTAAGYAHAQDASPSSVVDIEALSGWYRYSDTDWGCSDTEDNQYRAALGRYSVQDHKFTFGVGSLGFGFYDGGCEFFDPIMRDGKLDAIAICRSEGEDSTGRATIERLGPDRLFLHSPAMDAELVACPANKQPDVTLTTPDTLVSSSGFSVPLEPGASPSLADATSATELSTADSAQGSLLNLPTTPPFIPFPAGVYGTPFRGVALGQTRAEVEAALGAIGFRCLSADELSQIPENPIEHIQGYETCRVTPEVIPEYAMELLTVQMGYEKLAGVPFYAVSFLEGRASALSFKPDFFNAQTSTPYDFALSIVQNYSLPDGFKAIPSGWKGITSNNELVTVERIKISFYEALYMTVFAASPSDIPTFD